LLVTIEILITIVAPLVFLYLKGPWELGKTIPYLLSIPSLIWYLTYSPLHELSHIIGTYLLGGKVTYVKWIPRFWLGEYGRAWITPEGITESWQQVIISSFPYFLDVVAIVGGIWILRQGFSKNAFVIGLLFMFLCLRPFFDLVCETVGFLQGNKGDIYCIAQIVGSVPAGVFFSFSIMLSILAIVVVLKRFTTFAGTSSMAAV
jgi:hypothetical protein